MRCQRCGFEIEPGQTFCSMCGTEQAKAMREKKKKGVKSILGIIKITSQNHLKMWGNLGLAILSFLYILFACEGDPVQVPYICLISLIIMYLAFQCFIPYKNPNASKSKRYKIGMRTSFVLILILIVIVLFTGDFNLMDLAKSI